ncbi:TetR/AcrR family transcriptional regulator [Rhodococcus opacus]|uniref:TetR/AcrR family transcriptional regulator n=1 Tax=Rhodococcus TaxID=1827 RepID=UPI00131F5D05|nr:MULTISPECIES: TetR/AcrR family transcriptional regulator [Rhodococcus]MDJ0420109.1 TetR/AcrR family transcriptional regulator [Rhodococcus opacus]MDV7089050.1 TetR/AcrR family transcriptional regulator [Rhodococcus opacus]QHE73579.1 Transcriptional regulator, TetR family [Rhodococcus sp. WAY2]QTJ70761.1 TetR/AcrR family transcriptional regulator [Rhodococcus sp. ZPP]UNN04635.1 TetR/AcrR family transcriptional regulator [Rhodococcus opacus]
MIDDRIEPVRTRDPARRYRILAAAADLVARNGFNSVSMADIGAASGITGSAIYRHFDSKSAVLVELFDSAIDRLLEDAERTLDSGIELEQALRELVEGQIEFVVGKREVAQVYHNEIHNLPEDDRRRLRRKQRLYIEEWVHLVDELRSDLDDGEARAVVHAAIGAIQSSLFHSVGLPIDRLRQILADSALAVLGVNSTTT